MKKSDLNLAVIQNFILHITHMNENEARNEGGLKTVHQFNAEELYQHALDYIEEDHVDGKDNPEDEIIKNKYWAESSFVHDDKERLHLEQLIVCVDMGNNGTKSIASFNDLGLIGKLNEIIDHVNS